MIPLGSIFTLTSALGGAFLCIGTVFAFRGRLTEIAMWFVAMSTSITVGATAYFVQLDVFGPLPSNAADFGTGAYWLLLLTVAGCAGAVTYWFLFAAAYARPSTASRADSVAIAHIPALLAITAAATNPWHLSFVRAAGALTAPGLLASGCGLVLLGLGCAGVYRVLSAPVASDQRARQSRMVAASASLPILAAALWGLQGLAGLAVMGNPVPFACTIFVFGMGFQVFARGFAGVAPNLAELAFENASEALIAVDATLRVVAVNDAAAHLLPDIATGDDLRRSGSSLGRHAAECLSDHGSGLSFSYSIPGSEFLGRVRATRSTTGAVVGCVLLLTDITELKAARRSLKLLEREHEAERG